MNESSFPRSIVRETRSSGAIVSVQLCEFLRTGVLGPVRCGMSIEQIQEILGPAHEEAHWDQEQESNLRYDALQLWFDKQALSSFGLHFSWSDPIPSCVKVEDCDAVDRMTDGQLRGFLELHQIQSAEAANPHLKVVTTGGVIALVHEHRVTNFVKFCQANSKFKFFVEDDACLSDLFRKVGLIA